MPALWWRFTLPVPDRGTHSVRVVSIGTKGQQVFLDGSLLEAPPGTTTFTGPGGSLLEFLRSDGHWILTVDGFQARGFDPNSDPLDPPHTWNFGNHSLLVHSIGKLGASGARCRRPERGHWPGRHVAGMGS